MKDLDELRSHLEDTMHDLTTVLPHPLDWRPTLIYILEILDHKASQSANPEEFQQLLELLTADVQTRLRTQGWQ